MSSALIVGASGGIGSAIAKALAQKGWSLYLHYHTHKEAAQKLADELSKAYPKQDFFVIGYDFADAKHVQDLADQLFSVDAVVFAEGMTYYKLFKDTTLPQMQSLLAVHLLTPMALLTCLEDKLAQGGRGRVVFIGSVYGEAGSAMEVAYSTVKGAQSAFVHAYAKEVASLGITVNVVAPGAVNTKMNAMFSPKALEAVQAEIPAARLAQPDDIAYYTVSLLDEKASYLTGQTLNVTGGWLA